MFELTDLQDFTSGWEMPDMPALPRWMEDPGFGHMLALHFVVFCLAFLRSWVRITIMDLVHRIVKHASWCENSRGLRFFVTLVLTASLEISVLYGLPQFVRWAHPIFAYLMYAPALEFIQERSKMSDTNKLDVTASERVPYSANSSVCSVGVLPDGPRGDFISLGSATCIGTHVTRNGGTADEFLTATHVLMDIKGPVYIWRDGKTVQVKDKWYPSKCGLYEMMILRVTDGASRIGCKATKTVTSYRTNNVVTAYACVEGGLVKSVGTVAPVPGSAFGIVHTINTRPGWSGAGIFTPGGLLGLHHHGIERGGKGILNTGYDVGAVTDMIKRQASDLVALKAEMGSDTWNWFQAQLEEGTMEVDRVSWGQDEFLYTFRKGERRWVKTSDEIPDEYLDEWDEDSNGTRVMSHNEGKKMTKGNLEANKFHELLVTKQEKGSGIPIPALGTPLTDINVHDVQTLRAAFDEVDQKQLEASTAIRALSQAQIVLRRRWVETESDDDLNLFLQASVDIDTLQVFLEVYKQKRETLTAAFNEVMQKSAADETLSVRMARKKKAATKQGTMPSPSPVMVMLRREGEMAMQHATFVVGGIVRRVREPRVVAETEGLYSAEMADYFGQFGVKVNASLEKKEGNGSRASGPESTKPASVASQSSGSSSTSTTYRLTQPLMQHSNPSQASSRSSSPPLTSTCPPRKQETEPLLSAHCESILRKQEQPLIDASRLILQENAAFLQRVRDSLGPPKTQFNKEGRDSEWHETAGMKRTRKRREKLNHQARTQNALAEAQKELERLRKLTVSHGLSVAVPLDSGSQAEPEISPV
jgi:hypothetical protein